MRKEEWKKERCFNTSFFVQIGSTGKTQLPSLTRLSSCFCNCAFLSLMLRTTACWKELPTTAGTTSIESCFSLFRGGWTHFSWWDWYCQKDMARLQISNIVAGFRPDSTD